MSQSPHQLMFNLYNIIALTGENLNCGDNDGGYDDGNGDIDDGDVMIMIMILVMVIAMMRLI